MTDLKKNKSAFCFSILLLISLVPFDVFSQRSRSASGTVTSYSISLDRALGRISDGNGLFNAEVYFSTPDNVSNNYPQGLPNQLSYELRPSSPGSSRYSSEFAVWLPNYYGYAFYAGVGIITGDLPTTDSNGDNFSDFLDLSLSGGATVTASSSEYAINPFTGAFVYSGNYTFSLSFSRSAGSYSGIYTAVFTNGSNYTGKFYLEGGSGNAIYDPGARTIRFDGNSFSFDTSGSGASTYTVSSQNQVAVSGFSFVTSDGITRQVQGFTLNRSGNRYRANVVLVDGDPRTPYADFKDCRLEITDTNDWNGNGVPDLSDPPLIPLITSQPQNSVAPLGGVATFSVSASNRDSGPIFYQWRLNGTNVAQGTNATLQVTNAQPSLAGNYSVVVSNLFGSITSSNALLTVIQPPSFPPQVTNGLRGNLGSVLNFTSSLSGSAAVFTLVGQPPGLGVVANTGVITGTPTAAGYYRATLTASNLAGRATLPLTFTVPGTALSLPFSDSFTNTVPNRYMVLNLGGAGQFAVTSGVLRYTSALSDSNGALVAWIPNLTLALTNSWEVVVDAQMPQGWETPYAGVGMTLLPFSESGTVETTARLNRLNLTLGRDASNYLSRYIFTNNVEYGIRPYLQTNTPATQAALRLSFQAATRTLSSWYRSNGLSGWERLGEDCDMGTNSVSSLGRAWGLSNSSSLRVALYADSYATNGSAGQAMMLDNFIARNGAVPEITNTINLHGQVGQAYFNMVIANNDPIRFGASNLPDGLSNHPITGSITGIPATAGIFPNVILSASNPLGVGLRTNQAVILPVFAGTNYFAGSTARRMEFRVETGARPTNLVLTYGISNAPAGLSVDTKTGVVSGTPTTAGVYSNVFLTIANGPALASRRVTVDVAAISGDLALLFGRNALAQRRLSNAVTEFTDAVSRNTNNAAARVYKALSSLALLQQNAAGNAVLDKLWVIPAASIWDVGGMDPARDYRVDSRAYVGPYRYYEPKSRTLSTAEIISVLKTQHLPVELAAEEDLKRVTDPNFSLVLPRAETGLPDVRMDYGDVLMIRALLSAKRALDYFVGIHNWTMTISEWQKVVDLNGPDQRVTVENVLKTFPSLWRLSSAADAVSCRTELQRTMDLYVQASAVIRARPEGRTGMFNLYAGDREAEAELRARIAAEWRPVLSGPVLVHGGDRANDQEALRVNGDVFFKGLDLRAQLPQVVTNKIKQGTLPSGTFGGLLPSNTVAMTEGWLWDETPKNTDWFYNEGMQRWEPVSSGPAPGPYDFGLLPAMPTVTNGNAWGQVGVLTNYRIQTAGAFAGLRYDALNRPSGLEVDRMTGEIRGTPTAAGQFTNVILRAVGPAGTNNKTITNTILPRFEGTNQVIGYVNDSNFRHQVLLSSYPSELRLEFAASNLPNGLKIDSSSGLISGLMTNPSVFISAITIKANGASAQQNIRFTFAAAVGGGFSQTLSPGPTNIIGLPDGLTYTNGKISGIPRLAGNFPCVGQFSGGATTNFTVSILPTIPVITSPTNVVARAGQEFFYQIVAGGFGREWAGFDNFDSTNTNNWGVATNVAKASLVRTNGQLEFRPGTNTTAYQSSHLYWTNPAPTHISWLAYVDGRVSTNRVMPANQYGKAQLVAVQINSNKFDPSVQIPLIENITHSKLYRDSAGSRQKGEMTIGDVPWYGDFSSALDPAEYQSLARRSGVSLAPTNGLLRFRSGGGSTNDQVALVVPNLRLTLTRDWTVELDAQMANNWSTDYSGIGFSVVKEVPMATNVTLTNLGAWMSNRYNVKLGRSSGGNYLGTHSFAAGSEVFDSPDVSVSGTNARLRLRYQTSGMTLIAEGSQDGGGRYTELGRASLDPVMPGSLGQRWGLGGTNARLRLALWGETFNIGGTDTNIMALDNLNITIDPPEASRLAQDWSVCAIGFDRETQEIISYGWDYDGEQLTELLRTSAADWGLTPSSSFALVIGGHQQWADMTQGEVSFDNFALIPSKGFIYAAKTVGATNLPPSLKLDPMGYIYGSFPTAGTNSISVSVTGEGGTDTKQIRIVVQP